MHSRAKKKGLDIYVISLHFMALDLSSFAFSLVNHENPLSPCLRVLQTSFVWWFQERWRSRRTARKNRSRCDTSPEKIETCMSTRCRRSVPDGLEFGLTPVVFVETERPGVLRPQQFWQLALEAMGTVILLVG